DDGVCALDAFVDGGERWVDLGEVNGRVFVNNVSLGLYAEAVQQQGYRDAKIRTVLDTVPDILGPTGDELDLRWHGPGGHEHRGGAAVLVCNNTYPPPPPAPASGPPGPRPDRPGPGRGRHEHRGGAAVLVTKNAYRLGGALGSATRPRIDDG